MQTAYLIVRTRLNSDEFLLSLRNWRSVSLLNSCRWFRATHSGKFPRLGAPWNKWTPSGKARIFSLPRPDDTGTDYTNLKVTVVRLNKECYPNHRVN